MLGAVSLRVSGIAFAMVTLAFAQAGSILVLKNPHGWTGGEEGFGVDYHQLPAWAVGILNTKNLYWLALGYAAAVFAIVRWAVNSSPGHVWQAIRENELRVQVLGLKPYTYKLMSFVLASMLATAGGVIYLLLLGGANTQVTTASFTLTLLADGRARRNRVALGRDDRRHPLHLRRPQARRSLVVDAVSGLPSIFRTPLQQPLFILGVLFILVVFFVPGGLTGSAGRRASRSDPAQAGRAGGGPVKIAWESRGEGPPLLLIQGLGYGRWSWEPIVPGLAARHRVVCFDNRGIGESDKPQGPYTAAQMAGDALQVLDEAGIERAHVLGASLGGMIAQELAVAAPERVDRLVLCCTTPGGPDAVPMPEVTVRLFAEAAVARARGGAAAVRRERARRRIRRPSSSTSSTREGREPARPGRLAGSGRCGHGVPGGRRRDHRADADSHRHGRQRRRLPQRRGARGADPGLARRAARGLPATSSSGSSRTSASGSSTSSSHEPAHHRQDHPRPRADHAGPGRDRRGRSEWTYAELDARSDELARGLSHGDRVSTLTGNSGEHVALMFACAKAGAILHPISWRLAPAEVAYQLDDAEPAIFLIEEEYRELGEAALELAQRAARAHELAMGCRHRTAAPSTTTRCS